jgi:hypothetical protein
VKPNNDQQLALNNMAKWLSQPMGFGEKPVEQRIVYESEVSWPWEEHLVKVFLIAYRMKKGSEGIGLTGPTTWSFVDLDNWKALALEDLVRCYVGWYIRVNYINSKENSPENTIEKVNQFVSPLIKRGIADPNFYKVSDVFELGEDLTYYAIETIKDLEAVYIIGTENDYTFYKKDLPQMRLPPLFYFLGKTFNPFKKA